MSSVTAMPYAEASALEERNITTAITMATNRPQFTAGT
jgi:hypothetical protein